jgi:hypothetical protein
MKLSGNAPPSMKNITDWFDKVYLLNCAHRTDRLERITKHLTDTGLADMSRVIVYPAVQGRVTTTPEGWGAGPGAWGIYRTICRVMEDEMHGPGKTTFFLEDDAYFTPNALQVLNQVMQDVPDDWAQIYFGGQHRTRPVQVSQTIWRGTSISRTHAHAMRNSSMQDIYRYIVPTDKYAGSRHVDHIMEHGHQRRVWPVYCPGKWISGQDAGMSDISDGMNRRKIWN